MMPTTAILISRSADLIALVRPLTASVPALELGTFSSAEEAGDHLHRPEVGLVLVHLDGETGPADAARLLRLLLDSKRPVALVALDERHSPGTALELLRQGAADYLSRPLDLTRLGYLIDVLTVRARYRPEHRPPAANAAVRSLGEKSPLLYFPGRQGGMLMEQVQRVAPQDTTILLGGETGTGKTKLAQLIHELSARRSEPFLVLNCGALSPHLMESEMFGHVRGAFTGADRDRTGKFAEAGGGTLLLDDIDGLPLALQPKLLRAVEERLFEPVGSNKTQKVRARIIAASSRGLEQEVAAGRFRSDLYYRLNVVGFYLPPLRERPRDLLEALARSFLARFATGCAVRDIAPSALHALTLYHWPGNVRELRNAIERAAALSAGPVIQIDDLPHAIQAASAAVTPTGPADPCPDTTAFTLSEAKQEAEATHIREALTRHRNNRARVAAELGISRMTLYKKLHRYNLMGSPELA